eukprot:1158013-Pelagomonas_calceolata.AAC.5
MSALSWDWHACTELRPACMRPRALSILITVFKDKWNYANESVGEIPVVHLSVSVGKMPLSSVVLGTPLQANHLSVGMLFWAICNTECAGDF